MDYEDQHCLELFLIELKRHKETLLKDNYTATQVHQQRTITTFFIPITPTHATSKSRATQMCSWLKHNKGLTIDQVITISRACRLRPHGPQSHNPFHQQTKAIISCHRRCLPHSKTSPFWIDLCQRSFEDKNYKISDMRILHKILSSPFSLLSFFYWVIFILFYLLFSKWDNT